MPTTTTVTLLSVSTVVCHQVCSPPLQHPARSSPTTALRRRETGGHYVPQDVSNGLPAAQDQDVATRYKARGDEDRIEGGE
ncbi:hypothetical protein OF83DRAFT_1176777 [Amylostereum chailletii]|nr:hypothetical protein OF83DRAFT_1176777 [Amylostereum chailletii]